MSGWHSKNDLCLIVAVLVLRRCTITLRTIAGVTSCRAHSWCTAKAGWTEAVRCCCHTYFQQPLDICKEHLASYAPTVGKCSVFEKQ